LRTEVKLLESLKTMLRVNLLATSVDRPPVTPA